MEIIGGQGGRERRIVSTKVQDTISGRDNGASTGVSTASKANDFTTITIFLVAEGVEGEGGGQEIIGRVKH
jgi:hypothetical protein